MQVLRNLVNNAKKFSPPNKKIFVNAEKKEDHILFSVKDEGIGLSEQDQQRIFEPFYQAEQSMYREHGGTGLGLTICKGIIESQNGKMWIESKPGKGTTFFFTVPFTPAKETKPIRLLFSPQEDNEKKIKHLLKEVLGPLGEKEFKDLKKGNKIIPKHLFEYFDVLKEQGIIGNHSYSHAEKQINEIFSETEKGGKK